MAKLVWDQVGERRYETGTKKGVLYPIVDGKYPKGVAWNGLTAVTESPSGADTTAIYADDIKYLNLVSAEEFGGTIEAYMYPDEWMACDGSLEATPGVILGQQSRKTFGLVYETIIGNDTENNDYGRKLHLIWGALASPSERSYQTVNDSPEALSFSWEFTTTPVEVKTMIGGKTVKPVSVLTIDTTKVDADKLKKLEDVLFGSEDEDAKLPLPDEVIAMLSDGIGG